jgi:hypothetical protein
MEREIEITHPGGQIDLPKGIAEKTEGELFTIVIKIAQRVTRGLNELDNTDGGSRETFTVAKKLTDNLRWRY